MVFCRTLDSSQLYEQALSAIAGNHSYRYTATNGVADLVLHRPSVTLHETATPQPTMTRLRKTCNVKPEHFFKLEAFPNYISKRDYRPLQDVDGKDVWLADGDLCVGNLFAKHDKARLWVRDLADTRNGVGIYIANSRGALDLFGISWFKICPCVGHTNMRMCMSDDASCLDEVMECVVDALPRCPTPKMYVSCPSCRAMFLLTSSGPAALDSRITLHFPCCSAR